MRTHPALASGLCSTDCSTAAAGARTPKENVPSSAWPSSGETVNHRTMYAPSGIALRGRTLRRDRRGFATAVVGTGFPVARRAPRCD